MKLLVCVFTLTFATVAQASQLTCNYAHETFTAEWVSLSELKNVRISNNAEIDPSLAHIYASTTASSVDTLSANFIFDLDGNGNQREIFLPLDHPEGWFPATVFLEDGSDIVNFTSADCTNT